MCDYAAVFMPCIEKVSTMMTTSALSSMKKPVKMHLKQKDHIII